MNEQMLEYVCDESKTNAEWAIIKADYQTDLLELHEAGLVLVEPDGAGNYRVAATDGGYKWIAASKKAPEVVVVPMVSEMPANVHSGGFPGIDTPAEVEEKPVWVEPAAQPVIWDEPAPTAPVVTVTEPPATADMPVWARPKAIDAPPLHFAAPTPTPSQPAPTPSVVNPNIQIVAFNGPPPRKRGERKRDPNGINGWPFDTLEIGCAFHIPATVEHPYPHKTCNGLVIAANRKYSEGVVDGFMRPVMQERTFNKTVIDALTNEVVLHPDGTKKTVPVTNSVQVRRQMRKFVIYDAKRVPQMGQERGAWVVRVPVED